MRRELIWAHKAERKGIVSIKRKSSKSLLKCQQLKIRMIWVGLIFIASVLKSNQLHYRQNIDIKCYTTLSSSFLRTHSLSQNYWLTRYLESVASNKMNRWGGGEVTIMHLFDLLKVARVTYCVLHYIVWLSLAIIMDRFAYLRIKPANSFFVITFNSRFSLNTHSNELFLLSTLAWVISTRIYIGWFEHFYCNPHCYVRSLIKRLQHLLVEKLPYIQLFGVNTKQTREIFHRRVQWE